jgi:hypothetical protein
MNSIGQNDDPPEDQEIRKSFNQFFQQNMSKQNQQIGQQQSHSFNRMVGGGGGMHGVAIGLRGHGGRNISMEPNGGYTNTGSTTNNNLCNGNMESLKGSGNGGTAMLANQLQLENLCASPEHFNNLVNLDLMQHAAATAGVGGNSTAGQIGSASGQDGMQSHRSSNSSVHKDMASGPNIKLMQPQQQHRLSGEVDQAAHRNSSQVSVNHDYTDFAYVLEEDQELPPEVDDNNNVRKRNTGGVISPFPERLHDMLSKTNVPEVVGWAPHGRCFLVRKPKEFESKIMPLYFNHTKLTSFQRQLNLYGFKRITKGVDRGAYYHELFLRYRPRLCTRMRRQKVKGTGQKPLPDPENEPNFYAMKSVEAVNPAHRNIQNTNILEENELLDNSLEGDDFFGNSSDQVVSLKPRGAEPLPESLFDSPKVPRRTARHPFNSSAPPLQMGQTSPIMPSRTAPAMRVPRSFSDRGFMNSGITPDFLDSAGLVRGKPSNEGGVGGNGVSDLLVNQSQSSRDIGYSAHATASSALKPSMISSGGGSYEQAQPTQQLGQFQKKEKKGLHASVKKAFSKLTGSKKEKSKNEATDKVGTLPPPAQGHAAAAGAQGVHPNTNTARIGRLKRSSLIDKSAPRGERRESVKFHPEEVWFGTGNESRRSIQEMMNQAETRGSVRRLSQNRLSITSIGSLSHTMNISVGKDTSMSRRDRRISLMSLESFNFEDDADMLNKRMSLVSIGSALGDFKKDMERRESTEKAHSDCGSCAWIDDRVLNRRHSLQHSLDFDHLFDDSSLASSKYNTADLRLSDPNLPSDRQQLDKQLSTREAAAAVAAEFSFDDDDEDEDEDEDEVVSAG